MLERRGLYLDKKDDWEVHGPHKGMNYQVYVGLAYIKKSKEWTYVSIYPRSAYWIEDPCDWWKCEPENRIFIK
jgi:hypothetical protein